MTVSELWTLDLKSFADEHFNDPVYCIQSNIEASLYAGHKFRFAITENCKKLHFVTDLINKIEGNERILVVSNSDTELLEFSEFLINFEIVFDWLTKKTTQEQIRGIQAKWNSTLYSNILILCTDEVLRLTHIKNATVLINLSMPDLWTTFKFRFSALSHNTTIRKLVRIVICSKWKRSSFILYVFFRNR